MFIENYISTGILELNRVMQGGFKRGETCVISGARESSYESFFI